MDKFKRFALINGFGRPHVFNLQMFADGGADGGGADGGSPDNGGSGGTPPAGLTADDVAKMVQQGIAAWVSEQQKAASEAEKLGKMTAEEKAARELANLQKEVQGFKDREAKAAMTAQARTMLREAGLNVSDRFAEILVSGDAEGTKANVDEFISLLKADREAYKKELFKGETPRKGSGSGGGAMTLADIAKIPNRTERQARYAEYYGLNTR